jgi:hypothetical protein
MKRLAKLISTLSLITHVITAMETVMHVLTGLTQLITLKSRLKQKLSESASEWISGDIPISKLIFKKGE